MVNCQQWRTNSGPITIYRSRFFGLEVIKEELKGREEQLGIWDSKHNWRVRLSGIDALDVEGLETT